MTAVGAKAKHTTMIIVTKDCLSRDTSSGSVSGEWDSGFARRQQDQGWEFNIKTEIPEVYLAVADFMCTLVV